MLAMNNQINAARAVTKTHTGNVETFKSGDFGFIGEVWDDKVVFSRTALRRQHIDIGTAEMPRVEILAMFGGADGSLLRYAVDQGAKGIVVQAVGMGNMNVSMFEAVKYALSKACRWSSPPACRTAAPCRSTASWAAARPPSTPAR
jgi:L-asparaginase